MNPETTANIDQGHNGPEVDITAINFARGNLSLLASKVPVWDVNDETVHKIAVTQEGVTIHLRVQKYCPQDGDITWKQWVDNGTVKRHHIKPYALKDHEATGKDLEKFIAEEWSLLRFTEPFDSLVVDVYRYAAALSEADKGKTLLEGLLKLAFATSNTTGSSYLTGEDKLGMEPVTDNSCPQFGRVLIPRRLVDEVGELLHKIITALQQPVLKDLQRALESGNAEQSPQAFSAVFLLLHLIEFISEDRHRYAQQNCIAGDYSLPEYVYGLHQGADGLIRLWRQFANCVQLDWTNRESLRQAGFDAAGVDLISRCVSKSNEMKDQVAAKKYRGHFSFIVQMLEK